MPFKESQFKTSSIETNTLGMHLQVKVAVAGLGELSKDERWCIEEACQKTMEDLLILRRKLDPKVIENTQKIKNNLLECFPEYISYEIIPNEYCGKACCIDRLWLMVNTKKGKVKIGWRKRVINIDFAGLSLIANANEIFPNEDVTKFNYTIHAWGYDKAKEYLEKLLS